MKWYRIFILGVLVGLSMCMYGQSKSETQHIDNLITLWHKAASEADFQSYANFMTVDAVFVGTDPTEYWAGAEFLSFAKPYFDKGKAWNFNKIQRQVYTKENSKFAWFDELLDTQMGICRGSGVLVKTKSGWKINHYVLSITIPNENVDEIKAIKNDYEHLFLQKLINDKD